MLFKDIAVLILFCNPKRFGASFPGQLQKEIKAGSTRGQAAPLEEEKATRHTCKHVYLFIADAHCAPSWRKAGHPNRNVFQLARKGPDQML